MKTWMAGTDPRVKSPGTAMTRCGVIAIKLEKL